MSKISPSAIGASGPIAFLLIATVAGFLQPGYDLRIHTISESALGPFGWLQNLNFFAFGAAIVAFAISYARGLRAPSRVATLLLSLVGIGVMVEGIYPTDAAGAAPTEVGQIHNMVFLVAFLMLIVAYAFAAWAMRREPGWQGHAVYTALTAPIVLGLLFVFVMFVGDVGDPLYAVCGLFQRTLVLIAFGWMTVTGWRLVTQRRAAY